MTERNSNFSERLEQQFEQSARDFRNAFRRLRVPDDGFGFRMTAIPFDNNLSIGPIFSNGELRAPLRMPRTKIEYPKDIMGSAELRGLFYLLPDKWPQWQTMPYGARAEQTVPARLTLDQPPDYLNYQEIHGNGRLEMGFLSVSALPPRTPISVDYKVKPPPLWDGMFLGMLADLVEWARQVSVEAGAPTTEYVIDIIFRLVGKRGVEPGTSKPLLSTYRTEERRPIGLPGPYPRGQDFSLARYNSSFDGPKPIVNLLTNFDRDLWESFGVDISDSSRKYSVSLRNN